MGSNKEKGEEITVPLWVGILFICAFLTILFTLGLMNFVTHSNLRGTTVFLLGVLGVSFAFIGNSMTLEAVTKWGNKKLPEWKWGNRLQALGFAMTLFALMLSGI